jgi:drug/metabolite transporter (DMT)-like permease
VVVRGEGPPSGDFAIYAALAAVLGAAALTAFYRGLAIGAMGIVAPIAATGATIPVVVGVATGDRPSALQGVGLVLAMAGVALASREPADAAGERARVAAGVGLALIAAGGIGFFFLALDRASEADPMWATFVGRAVSSTLLAFVVLAVRPTFKMRREWVPTLVLAGVLDVGANLLFAIASTKGLVSVVSVLGSLYPVVTILMARFVLHERTHAVQAAGAALALLGVAFVSAGG